ncbi:hypothetical protein EBR66_08090 [bacterium]|nr:hypothetical protein [bacterium]
MPKITKIPFIIECDNKAMARNMEKPPSDRLRVVGRHLPGIRCETCSDEKYVYKTVFFGGTREYTDDEGWQPVTRRRMRWRGSQEAESSWT